MVTNNKVLTVSYGTFSCTLEGFDDSFDTMKAIAEYFRDLAADDRYFGAEPPTPDAEMLARIAEREIDRRVSARTEHGAIVLSTDLPQQESVAPVADEDAQETAAEAEAETAEQEAPAPSVEDSLPQDEPVVADEQDVLSAVAEADASSDEVEQPAEEATAEEAQPQPTIVEDITDDVLAAVAADEPEITELPEEEVAEEAAVETVLSEIIETSEDEPDETLTPRADDPGEIAEAEIVTEPREIEVAEIVEETPAEAPSADESVAEEVEPAAMAQDDDDSIAAKLRRIRAVVSKSREEPEEERYSEDEHAETLLSDTARDIESVLRLDEDMAVAATETPVEVAEVSQAAEPEILDEAAESAEAEEDAAPLRARVVRMKKADFEAAVESGLLEAEAEEIDDAEVEKPGDSSLTAQEEAELMAELAQVEAELNSFDEQEEEEPVEAIAAEPVRPERPARGHHLREAPSRSEADMSRLMNEAQNQMNEPDGSRRRRAIAHLRAAVAATKAEQKPGSEEKPRDAAEAYRDDLASVVRPVEPAPRPSKPVKKQSPAPLKLVAEQRVDAPEEISEQTAETPRAPVRPRRVSAADRIERKVPAPAPATAAPVGSEYGSFAEFAESVGAVQLQEVLEAAAAYLTFVEGLDMFSRPMIVRMAQGMDEDRFTREDSLRGFGQLLRDSKIVKVAGGRFTATEQNEFYPADRAAS